MKWIILASIVGILIGGFSVKKLFPENPRTITEYKTITQIKKEIQYIEKKQTIKNKVTQTFSSEGKLVSLTTESTQNQSQVHEKYNLALDKSENKMQITGVPDNWLIGIAFNNLQGGFKPNYFHRIENYSLLVGYQFLPNFWGFTQVAYISISAGFFITF